MNNLKNAFWLSHRELTVALVDLLLNRSVSDFSPRFISTSLARAYLMVDNHVHGVRSCSVKLRSTHLLLGLAVFKLQLQNPLETAAGSHSIAKGQVALALSQMALWVKDLQFTN